MNRYWFERWFQGKCVGVEMCFAINLQHAVYQLSEQYSGVFLLKDKQTEVQRNRENWQEFYRRSESS